MEKHFIKSTYLKAKFGDSIDYGFTSIPNLLIDYASEIGLDDASCWFIIQILRVNDKRKEFITDEDINMCSSKRTMARIRSRLKEIKDHTGKTLIEIKTFYVKDNETGKIKGAGTSYNFEKLFSYFIEIQRHIENLVGKIESEWNNLDANLADGGLHANLAMQGQNGKADANLSEHKPKNDENEVCFDKMAHIYKELKNKELLKNMAKIFPIDYNLGIPSKLNELIKCMDDDKNSFIKFENNKLVIKYAWVEIGFKQMINQVLDHYGMWEKIKVQYL